MSIEMVGRLAKQLAREGLLDRSGYSEMQQLARQEDGIQKAWEKLTELNVSVGEWASYTGPYQRFVAEKKSK